MWNLLNRSILFDFNMLFKYKNVASCRCAEKAVPSPPFAALNAFKQKDRSLAVIKLVQQRNRGFGICKYLYAKRDDVMFCCKSTKFFFIRKLIEQHDYSFSRPSWKKLNFHTKTQRHEERPIENIQVFLYVLRDLCVRTTFYEAIIIVTSKIKKAADFSTTLLKATKDRELWNCPRSFYLF